MDKVAKIYMIFDMLGDTVRTGPIIWKVNRNRTEDVKNHTFDLLLMIKLLKSYFPSFIDYEKLENYIIVHDLEEAITGDITIFEGIPHEEKERVNNIAMNWIIDNFNDVLDFKTYFTNFEGSVDIEAKIAHMLDKVQGSIPFMKYDGEKLIDINNPEIIETLRNHPAVVDGRNEGKTVGQIFYEFHLKKVVISDDELIKYDITRCEADKITNAIKAFMASIRMQCMNVKSIIETFPNDATKYNKNI